MSCKKLMCLIVITILLKLCTAYKPVFIMHGILSGAENMEFLSREIEESHPGTKVYNCDEFSEWSSLESAWRQVLQIGQMLMEVCEMYPEGVNVLGYSQGGLIARAVLQAFPDHNVKTFISLSSPQAGQYGTEFLRLIFPNLIAENAFELFYSRLGQHTSVGNYWNDPHKQELYLQYSAFLPYVNNEILSINSTQFKSALTKLDRMVLIGGPNDGVITPWQSSHFGYYNQTFDVIPFHQRDIFLNDTIGLKTLDENGKLIVVTKPNVHHLRWHNTPEVIREVILPYLD